MNEGKETYRERGREDEREGKERTLKCDRLKESLPQCDRGSAFLNKMGVGVFILNTEL